jgi:hypothetical protein
MKNILMKIAGLFLITLIMAACMEDPIKEAQENYDYNQIIPKVLDGVQGAATVNQTFTADYTINYYRGGSTWNWTATDATIKSVSADTRTATILFNTLPASGKAVVTVTETTMGGVTSDPVSKQVTVNKYCPLANGVASLVGSWGGTDGAGDYTYPADVTTVVSGTNLSVTGVSFGFMGDFWGETIKSGGSFIMKVNIDGTLVIDRQYIYTTDYKGDAYDYEIKGSGTWDNCGAKPKLTITYDIYYPGDAKGLAATYPSYLGGKTALTATLTMK